MKDFSKNIKEFEKLPDKDDVRKRPKHETTASYFYLTRQLDKFMMRSDDFNFHIEPVRKETTGTQQNPISKVCDLNKRKSKEIIADEKLSQVCSTNKRESENVIVNEGDTDESGSKNIHKSINTNREKYVFDESDHE